VGIDIDRESFDEAEHEPFLQRLFASLRAIRTLLERPGFGEGAPSIGAELELNLIDSAGRPARCNEAVLKHAANPRLALELNQFNLEINSTPVDLTGAPFTAIGDELRTILDTTQVAAAHHGARLVPVGILPTLSTQDVLTHAMTDRPRYRALSNKLREMRGGPFRVRINGIEPIEMGCDAVTLEGAATSLQLHLRSDPSRFADIYNAAQIATAPALAVASNSPFFLGHRLWDETRIALFKQAVDARTDRVRAGWPPPRVSFGHGWVRRGALELFAEAVSLHHPLLPAVSDEDPEAVVAAGGVPGLEELRLHCGTIWRWNRPVYDATAGGHIRIELRALPAGPTVVDMMANAAFLLGLTLGLAPKVYRMVAQLPFECARHNFYRAAQDGLNARLLWPCEAPPSPRPEPVMSLIARLLDTAYEGLIDAGVDSSEASVLLDVIRNRCETGTTGAHWQRHAHLVLEDQLGSRADALHELVNHYCTNVHRGQPVHEWPLLS